MEKDKMLLNLMQNVVDKLDLIISKVNAKKEVSINEKIIKSITDCPHLILGFTDELLKNREVVNTQIKQLEKQIKDAIINTKPVIQNHQKKNYILFGKDTPFTSRLLLIVMLFVLSTSYSFKYVPDYLIERSDIKLQRDQYKLFYEYIYLNSFDRNVAFSEDVVETFNKIKQKDSTFMMHIDNISKKHDKALRKEELEEQLRILNTSK